MATAPPIDPAQLAQILGGQPGGPQPAGQAGPPLGAAGGPATPPYGASQDSAGQQQPQGSPTDQAVWSLYPSTDPNAVAQLFPQGGGAQELAQGIMSWEQAAEQDRAAFEQRQSQTLQHMISMLVQPQMGQAQAAPGPGAGGQNTGY
jgi:hypothetical protein